MCKTRLVTSAVLERCQRVWHRQIVPAIKKIELIFARCSACIGIAVLAREHSAATRQLAHLARVILIAAILLPLTAAAPAKDERRIALVIGISAYQNAPRLANPINDAGAIGESLRRLKFDVVELDDPGLQELSHSIRNFGVSAAAADVAVVYYAGHGVQVDRENYLIPADAKLERERDLLYEAMPLNWLLGEVSQASKIGIVLLDSCRNNPFIERITRSMTVAGRAVATTPGLARVDNVPRNTMVVMAAKANQVAEDGGEHSPFAAALLAHLQIPGMELSLFFRSVRDTVLRATNNRQEPFVFSSLGAEPFYFYPRLPNRPPQIGAIPPLEVTDAAGPTPLGMPQPTDPDQNPLTVRIVALPRSGTVLIDHRTATVNAVYSAERFSAATYKPDGKTLGAVGTLDILVEDGRGGSVAASLPITVKSSHRPPVVASPGRIHVAQQALGIPPPTSLDGDALTITVTALPRGTVGNDRAIVRTGDRLTLQELASLTFTPETGFTGAAGALRYMVDNGHGSVVEGMADIDVGTAPAPAALNPEMVLWERVQSSTDPAQLDAFLRLFPTSSFAAEAAHRREELVPPVASHAPISSPQIAAIPSAPGFVRPVAPALDIPNAAAHPVDIAATDATPSTQPQVMMAANNPAVALPAAVMGPETFQDCPTCPPMTRIETGSYMMGLGSREPEALPAHRVEIRSFAIGIVPVTVAEWKACVAAHGCSEMPRMHVAEDETPVHNVSWDDAQTYVAWLARVTGHRYRLPNEAEWEYAARGGTTTRYWWGESAGVALANCVDCGGNQDAHGPWPVTTLRPNPFGLYDMLGGVAQWVEDCWFPNYQMAPTDGSAREMRNCQKRVLRGGSFRNRRDEITVMARGNYDGPVRYIANGFRVARDLD